MTHDVGGHRRAALEHSLDQVDAAARRIELIAEQDIGGAGRGAEAAMDAFADDRIGFGDLRVGELGGGEVGLHGFRQNGVHAAGVENPGRIECLLYPLGQLGQGSGSGSKTNTDARRLSGPRIKVAWPVAGGMAPRTTCAEPCSESGTDTHSSPPAQS